jgi:hypothetical protein
MARRHRVRHARHVGSNNRQPARAGHDAMTVTADGCTYTWRVYLASNTHWGNRITRPRGRIFGTFRLVDMPTI